MEQGAFEVGLLGIGPGAQRGGGVSKSTGAWTECNIDVDAMIRPDLEQGNSRTLNMGRLGEILTQPHAGESDGPAVYAFINWNCNPLVSTPDAEATRRGLSRDDLFTVVHEQFLTDTARYADIVLPATTQIETDDVVLSWGSLHINYNHAAIDPPGETVNTSWVMTFADSAWSDSEPATGPAMIPHNRPTMPMKGWK